MSLLLKCAWPLFLALAATAALAQDGAVQGVITSAEDGKPLPRGTVLVVELNRAFRAGDDGRYRANLPSGSYLLLATAPGYESAERVVDLPPGGEVNANFELAETIAAFGEEMVVIGSRKARTAADSAVPIDVLGREEIAQAGFAETSRILQFLAPSFNHSTSTISDGTDIVRPSTLRGLGPDQTLVLLNGKRRHNSALVHVNGSVGRGTAGVDLNAIPASAIERIEVLRDGASAQYGSDAIAGVINVALKTNTDRTELQLNTGQHYEEDGENLQFSANHGWRIGAAGYFNLTAEYRDRGATNRAGLDPRQQYPNLPDGSPDPREAGFDRLNHRYGDADSENIYLFGNFAMPLSDESELYAFAGVSARDGESGGFYRRALDNRNRPEIHPDGFLPLIATNVDDQSLTLGYKRLFGAWAMDLSATTGGNSFEFVIRNSVNASVGDGSLLNPDLLDPGLLATLRAQASENPTTANAGELEFNQTAVNLDFSGATLIGDRNVNLAFGAEFRTDSYQIHAGDALSWADGQVPNQSGGRAAAGIQVFPGFRPANEVDEDRSNLGLYGELETNLSKKLLVNAALRYEDYDDFGDNLSVKAAFRGELGGQAAIRGSVSTGFRAPSLHQSFFNNTSTQFVVSNETGELVPFEVGTFRQGSPVTDAFGVPPLEEETSTSYSLGFTARPRPNLQITLDAFGIDIEDRIVVTGRFQGSGDPDDPITQILAPFDVNGAQFFTNAVNTETRGLDLVIAWTRELSRGALNCTLAANWNETEVVDEVKTPAPLAGLGETLFDRVERERMETAQPRQAYNLGFNYLLGELSVMLRLNYFGSVKTVESASDPSRDQVHGGKWVADLEFSQRFANGLQWAIGGQNLFDVFPDEQIARNSFNGIFPYSRRTAPFGFNGGYYYVRLGYSF